MPARFPIRATNGPNRKSERPARRVQAYPSHRRRLPPKPTGSVETLETLRRPSLRSQLNQIRLWVRQGRTDAWIAHKLDFSIDQLERFKRDHDLEGEGAAPGRP